MKKHVKITLIAAAGVLLIAALAAGQRWFGWIPEKTFTAADFGLETVQSGSDFNGNGFDDLADLVRGAREDAERRPRYNGAYYDGGYPPENVGVCTDLVWRAFRAAGWSLKEMADADIAARPAAYPDITAPDPNIDFRRVGNLHVFFETYGLSLTTDVSAIGEWQPGDIVIFGADKHIGIVSDKRNKNGQPYILHNAGQWRREENLLPRRAPTAHYRFDPENLPAELKIPFRN